MTDRIVALLSSIADTPVKDASGLDDHVPKLEFSLRRSCALVASSPAGSDCESASHISSLRGVARSISSAEMV